jgi:hypothetical protein
MRKKLKISSDGSDCGSKKFKGDYGGTYGAVWWNLRLSGFSSHAIGFFLVRLARIWLQSPYICFHINLLSKDFL